MAKLENCLYISDFGDYDRNTPLSYSHQHFKSKITSGENDIVVNTDFIPTKYFDIIKDNAQTITLTDAEYINYKYQPKKFCFDRYGSIELWGILLRLNNMTSVADFTNQTFKTPPSNILTLLNEMMILEVDNIEKNNESIE